MLKTARPRRSVLYMPGSNSRALEKGRSLPADALILDLEDAVAPDAKREARAKIVAALQQGGYGRREIIVRINGLDSDWGNEDLEELATAGADALLLPKVESAEMVRQAEALMVAAGAPEELALMCMMETPLGILKAAEIAAASPRLSCLVMGTSDLVKDLNALHTPERLPVLTALSLCVLAARANGLAVVDGVHLDLNDAEGFAAQCLQGRQLGFDGKTLIHPKTIEKANEVFGPSAAEVAEAQRIIEVHAAAVKEGQGVAVLDGKLIENLHVETARKTVSLAQTIAELERSNTEQEEA
ncbi:MAG TPA: CoA ester lyase [Kiloniellales bacterium]|nr:CoA ester lyase [Kiloniellales bacterium]